LTYTELLNEQFFFKRKICDKLVTCGCDAYHFFQLHTVFLTRLTDVTFDPSKDSDNIATVEDERLLPTT